jgi:hypothetical protein
LHSGYIALGACRNQPRRAILISAHLVIYSHLQLRTLRGKLLVLLDQMRVMRLHRALARHLG